MESPGNRPPAPRGIWPQGRPYHDLSWPRYLAQYTHRVAIANSRLESVKDGMVAFRYKDRKNNTTKRLTIGAVEFIRRFFLHILPDRFHRIRHYGFLANRYRNENLANIRKLMGLSDMPEKQNQSVEQMMLKLTGMGRGWVLACFIHHLFFMTRRSFRYTIINSNHLHFFSMTMDKTLITNIHFAEP